MGALIASIIYSFDYIMPYKCIGSSFQISKICAYVLIYKLLSSIQINDSNTVLLEKI